MTFDFWCPTEQKISSAKADPAALLFGGATPLQVECLECGTKYLAEVSFQAYGAPLRNVQPLPQEDTDGTPE